MARPREFDETEALTSAMSVFRAKGYEAASLMDLLKAMDLSKSSLYNSFGTKHQLFIASIDHYIANYIREVEDRLNNAHSVKEGLRDALGKIIDMSTGIDDRRGCFLCMCASEVLPHDDVAEAHIRNGMNRLQRAFTDFVKSAQQRGEISPTKDADDLGEFLLMSMIGLQAIGRISADRTRADKLLNQVEAMLF